MHKAFLGTMVLIVFMGACCSLTSVDNDSQGDEIKQKNQVFKDFPGSSFEGRQGVLLKEGVVPVEGHCRITPKDGVPCPDESLK